GAVPPRQLVGPYRRDARRRRPRRRDHAEDLGDPPPDALPRRRRPRLGARQPGAAPALKPREHPEPRAVLRGVLTPRHRVAGARIPEQPIPDGHPMAVTMVIV